MRQWERLAACADQGPCQMGFSYFIDLPNTEREQHSKTRIDFFSAGFSFPLFPVVQSTRQPREVTIIRSSLDFVGAPPSFDPAPLVVPDPPSRPTAAGGPGASNSGGMPAPGAGGEADPPPINEQAVPEPASMLLVAAGLGALLFRRRTPAPRV